MNFNEGLRLTNGCHSVLREYLKLSQIFFLVTKPFMMRLKQWLVGILTSNAFLTIWNEKQQEPDSGTVSSATWTLSSWSELLIP